MKGRVPRVGAKEGVQSAGQATWGGEKIILTWRLEGEVVFYKGEQGTPGPERLSVVPNFTVLYCWTSAEI